MKPDPNVVRVHRLLAAKKSPQAVVRDRRGHLELIDASSVRYSAISRSPEWSLRVVGVFTPSVSLPVFQREVGGCS